MLILTEFDDVVCVNNIYYERIKKKNAILRKS